MAVDEKNVSKLFSVLSNKLRRDILSLLYEKKELSFSDLMNALDIDTGKMSFHLRNLKMFLEQTPSGKYRLNSFGQNALRLIRDTEALSIEVDFQKRKS
ncbi:MAG: helix-turn-helix domain-containing protein, partial [Candidatus Bathyarchaeota archaeon]